MVKNKRVRDIWWEFFVNNIPIQHFPNFLQPIVMQFFMFDMFTHYLLHIHVTLVNVIFSLVQGVLGVFLAYPSPSDNAAVHVCHRLPSSTSCVVPSSGSTNISKRNMGSSISSFFTSWSNWNYIFSPPLKPFLKLLGEHFLSSEHVKPLLCPVWDGMYSDCCCCIHSAAFWPWVAKLSEESNPLAVSVLL